MHSRTCLLALSALLVGSLPPADASKATPFRGIRDDAEFFSAETKKEADEVLRRLHNRTGRELVIETFSAPPFEAEKGDPYAHEALSRAKDLKVNGVYIAFWKKPRPHFHIEVGNRTEREGFFTEADERELKKILGGKGSHDEKLMEAVRFVASRMEAHEEKAKSSAPAPESKEKEKGWSPLGWVCIGLSVLAGLWLVVGLVRAFNRPAPPAYGGGGGGPVGGGAPVGGGGGGFFPSLLGGLFGAAAGMWMYDSFFGGHSHSGGMGGTGDTGIGSAAGSGTGPDTGPDTDYSGAGGDLDDNTGGASENAGDFGGDDGGGDFGDSGGGDFGGGGYDGGGDF